MLQQPHQFPYPDDILEILMVLKPNSKNISKIDIKTVVTAWHSPHLEREIFRTNRDFNLDKEISALSHISRQVWDLPRKEMMSYRASKISVHK
jgi:hypothetical protein